MKLVFIYGPPGVGKLTTARALAELTGFRVFHNHLTVNLVKSVFDFQTPAFWELAETIWVATLGAAARAGLPGLIFTMVYAAPEDDRSVRQIIEAVEKHGGQVLFVRLSCDVAVHEARVVGEERRALGKMATVESLRGALARWNLTSTIPARDTLAIDNSTVAPDAVARRIAAHFSLPFRG